MNPIGYRVIRLDEATSTNSLAMETPEYLDNHGTVVMAAHQTAGRGRIGRKWTSVPGTQLQFSVVVHPTMPREQVPVTSLLTGLAVAECLEELLDLKAELKWPNDVLLDGRKVCGILLELKLMAKNDPRLVVGIGINCLGPRENFPLEVRDILTTLETESSGEVDTEAVLQGVLEKMEEWFGRLVAGERQALLIAWARRARLSGRQVRYPSARGPQQGKTLGLTEDGFLLIETQEGGHYIHTSGEIQWED